jgi:hypothetical protein
MRWTFVDLVAIMPFVMDQNVLVALASVSRRTYTMLLNMAKRHANGEMQLSIGYIGLQTYILLLMLPN